MSKPEPPSFPLFGVLIAAFFVVSLSASAVLLGGFYGYQRNLHRENIRQQISNDIEHLRGAFAVEFQKNLLRNLHHLDTSTQLDDYLAGSEDQKPILIRKVERLFLQDASSFEDYQSIRFIDAAGREKISVIYAKPNRELSDFSSGTRAAGTGSGRLLADAIGRLFLSLKSKPAGSIEVENPLLGDQREAFLVAGISKPDAATGRIAGMICICVNLNGFLSHAARPSLLGGDPIWVFTADGRLLRKPLTGEWSLDPREYFTRPPSAERVRIVEDSKGITGCGAFSILKGKPLFRVAIGVPVRFFAESLGYLIRLLALGLVISMSVSIIISLFLARLVSQPFAKLTQAVKTLASGNFSGRVDIRTRLREAAKLLDNFNSMTEKLEETTISRDELLLEIKLRQTTESALEKASAESEKTRSELIQAEKMASFGRFSNGVAHEIKNPLGIILGGIELLKRKVSNNGGDGPDVQETLRIIEDATFRADTVVRRMMQFSRPSDAKRERVSSKELVTDVMALLKYPMSIRNVDFEVELDETLFVEVDKNEMQQVIFNVVSNSIEAMPHGGVLSVRSYVSGGFENELHQPACVIQVTDTGEGISDENLGKLFEPFFTTKRDSKGTGLGLVVSKTIVESHHGLLLITSQQGKGTTARILLPKAGATQGVL